MAERVQGELLAHVRVEHNWLDPQGVRWAFRLFEFEIVSVHGRRGPRDRGTCLLNERDIRRL